jgi:hypothetical protein
MISRPKEPSSIVSWRSEAVSLTAYGACQRLPTTPPTWRAPLPTALPQGVLVREESGDGTGQAAAWQDMEAWSRWVHEAQGGLEGSSASAGAKEPGSREVWGGGQRAASLRAGVGRIGSQRVSGVCLFAVANGTASV